MKEKVCIPVLAGPLGDLLTGKRGSPSYVNVINIHNVDFMRKIVRA